jgi:hypothetical protein
MTYEAAILYIFQRMRELGKTPDQYHFEPVRIIRPYADLFAGRVVIQAYNELYILINPQNYTNLLIVADNSTYTTDTPNSRGVPEFTGLIRLLSAATMPPQPIAAMMAVPSILPGPNYIMVDFLRVIY